MRCGIVIALTVGFVSYSVCGMAQTPSGYTIPKPEEIVKIPPSPEVKAFEKYGSTPLSPYTGSMDVSIPIATLDGRSISVPINLRYDASGVKVDQIATWVGLGWNLDVGGAVTRQTVGLPDDYFPAATNPDYFPFYSNEDNIDDEIVFVSGFTVAENSVYEPGLLQRYFDLMKKIVAGSANEKIEYQPDTYSFNALGISGTLLIDYSNNTAWCLEHPEYKATPSFSNTGSIPIKVITGWIIVDATGNTYYFQQAEITHVNDNTPGEDIREYNSSWLLTKVESTNKRDVIQFNYDAPQMWEQEQLAGRGTVRIETVNGADFGIFQGDVMNESSMPSYKISQANLTSIVVNGKVAADFNTSSTPRQDLAGKNT